MSRKPRRASRERCRVVVETIEPTTQKKRHRVDYSEHAPTRVIAKLLRHVDAQIRAPLDLIGACDRFTSPVPNQIGIVRSLNRDLDPANEPLSIGTIFGDHFDERCIHAPDGAEDWFRCQNDG